LKALPLGDRFWLAISYAGEERRYAIEYAASSKPWPKASWKRIHETMLAQSDKFGNFAH
jgi:hypothetical protein